MVAADAWNDAADRVRSFAKESGMNYTVLLDGAEIARKYDVDGIPTAFYIDPQGNVRSSVGGAESGSEMEDGVKAILPSKR